MTIYGTDTITARVEQMLAYGRSLAYIIEHLNVTEERVFDIADHMDAAALHTDEERAEFGDNCRKGLHALTPENSYVDPAGRRFCRPCKKNHRRESYARDRKAS